MPGRVGQHTGVKVVSAVPGSPSGLESFADQLGAEVVESTDEAVAATDIVTTATPATAPLFDAASCRPETHLNAIGAFTPHMAELPPALLHTAWVVVDDREAAAREAGDLLQADRLPDAEMSDLLATRAGPPTGATTTVYKSTGVASMDVAAAVVALHNLASKSSSEHRAIARSFLSLDRHPGAPDTVDTLLDRWPFVA